MNSRLDKYNDDNNTMSRSSRNENLYRTINDEELDNFKVRSNSTIIGNQEQDIDIEKLKKILDTRYNQPQKRNSIAIDQVEEKEHTIVEDTKEYDLNMVLEKAKGEKEETYEEVRNKKLHDTQFNILNNLNINKDSLEDDINKQKQDDLLNLINTITINETKLKEQEEVVEEKDDNKDLFDDLMGDDNTQVYASMKEDVQELNDKIKEADSQIIENKKAIDNSFYTSNLFKQKDFQENDFVDDAPMSLWLKILIVVVVIAFLVGLYLFLKSFIGF